MARMLTFSLQSGSNGNAIYVEAGATRLLFDAGISGAQAQQRMQRHGRNVRDVDALIISHDHIDHVRCMGVYQRKFNIPIYITQPTYRALPMDPGRLKDLRFFRAGDPLTFGAVTVRTIPTPHDAKDGVAFVVEFEGRRLGILTDLGHAFDGLAELLATLDAAYLECNYDPHMLETGPYPWPVKQRIKGPGGHLSNDDSAVLLKRCGCRLPRWIAVSHLSEENNVPQLAIDVQRSAVGQFYPVHWASRYDVSEVFEV